MRSATEVSTSLFFCRIISVANRIARYVLIGTNIALVMLNAWTVGRQLSILAKDREWPGGTLADMFNVSFFEIARQLPAPMAPYAEFVFYELHILFVSALLFALVWLAIKLLNVNYGHIAATCRRLESELASIRISFRLGHQ